MESAQSQTDILSLRFQEAVQYYWDKRQQQQDRQREVGRISDAGRRSEVTGGKQMAKLEELIAGCIEKTGIQKTSIRMQQCLELPGYYRSEKRWDLLVVDDNQLVLAIELKAQAGPSFSNNFNNRTEEAIGNASDLWVAYRDGRLGSRHGFKPMVGYLFLLEDCPEVHGKVGVAESNFPVDPVFRGASYAMRYEILCSRMVSERLYDFACLTFSTAANPTRVSHPRPDMSILPFLQAVEHQCQRWLSIRG